MFWNKKQLEINNRLIDRIESQDRMIEILDKQIVELSKQLQIIRQLQVEHSKTIITTFDAQKQLQSYLIEKGVITDYIKGTHFL